MIPNRPLKKYFWRAVQKTAALSGILMWLALAGCRGADTAAGAATDLRPSPNLPSAQTNQTDQTRKETNSDEKFLVIAHRGASGYRPEHTLAAYQLAIDQGADFIETDLVPTKDGVLIARHENALAVVKLNESNQIVRNAQGEPEVLAATTDVAERKEFARLLRVRTIDGRAVGGWFSEDFTIAEIKTLFARERIPQLRPDNTAFTRQRIPSLDEIIDLVERAKNRHVGIYPELKHPTHFRFGRRQNNGPVINIDTAKLLVQKLVDRKFTHSNRLYIQCFEVESLRRLKHELLPRASFSAPLVQLTGNLSWHLPDVQFHLARSLLSDTPEAYLTTIYGPLAGALAKDSTYGGLTHELPTMVADYAAGLGPRKGDVRGLGAKAKALGMQVHPYTVRAEPFFLSPARGGLADSVAGELEILRRLGATGVFIDQPRLASDWVKEWETAP